MRRHFNTECSDQLISDGKAYISVVKWYMIVHTECYILIVDHILRDSHLCLTSVQLIGYVQLHTTLVNNGTHVFLVKL